MALPLAFGTLCGLAHQVGDDGILVLTGESPR